MPLYRCSKCGCVENTAMSNYWRAADKAQALCSECDPAIGQWHGQFPKRSAVGMLIDQNGHLWSRETVEAGQLPVSYQIVGEVVHDLLDSVPELMESARDMGIIVTPSQIAAMKSPGQEGNKA